MLSMHILAKTDGSLCQAQGLTTLRLEPALFWTSHKDQVETRLVPHPSGVHYEPQVRAVLSMHIEARYKGNLYKYKG